MTATAGSCGIIWRTPGWRGRTWRTGRGVTPATLWRRLERLVAAGVIGAEQAVIDWRKLGYGVEVSLRFTLGQDRPAGL